MTSPVYSEPGEVIMDSKTLVYFKKGESTWGEPLLFNNIWEYNLQSNLKVYPNPTSRHISLNWDGTNSKDMVTYSILDVFGGLRNKGEFNLSSESIIDISYLEPGIYFIFFPEFKLTRKIIKL